MPYSSAGWFLICKVVLLHVWFFVPLALILLYPISSTISELRRIIANLLLEFSLPKEITWAYRNKGQDVITLSFRRRTCQLPLHTVLIEGWTHFKCCRSFFKQVSGPESGNPSTTPWMQMRPPPPLSLCADLTVLFTQAADRQAEKGPGPQPFHLTLPPLLRLVWTTQQKRQNSEGKKTTAAHDQE